MKSELITMETVRALLPKRGSEAHKGDCGRALLIAGSPGMAGAAVLAAGAALRGGAGLVYVSTDRELWPIIQTHEPCAVCCRRWKDTSEGALPPSDGSLCDPASPEGEDISSVLVSGTPYDNYDAVAVGPGLGTSDIAAALVAGVLAEYAGPLLLDADALNIVASCGGEDACRDGIPGCAAARRPRKDGSCVNACIPRRIVTPHPGEAARLLGTDTASVQADRAGAAAELARRYGAVAVLKGHRTLVAAPMPARDHGAAPVPAEIAITENTTGNPGMATGGSGDALTGLILAFCAQGMPAADAARAGVYIHGLAGDLAAAEKGEYGMIASDIVSFLPNAILKVTKS